MKYWRMVFLAVPFAVLAFAQAPQAVAPSDNLVLDGIPSIPARIAEQAGRYTEFRAAVLQSWNPKSKEMLVSTRFADVPQSTTSSSPGAPAHSSHFSRSASWAGLSLPDVMTTFSL